MLNHYRLPGLPVVCCEYPAVPRDAAKSRAKLAELAQYEPALIVDLTTKADRVDGYDPAAARFPAGQWGQGSWAPERLHAPIPDAGVPDLLEAFAALIERIGDRTGWVAVHCRGGIGRTGMVAAGLLVRAGWPVEEALDAVNALWRGTPKAQQGPLRFLRAPETEAQWGMVRAYAARGVPAKPMRLVPPSGAGRWHGLRAPSRLARACLLGGAIGDALGAPVEVRTLAEIQRDYGEAGITTFDDAYGVRGAITDDTQMTLFTAEGVLRGLTHWWHGGSDAPAVIARRSYLRWAATQEPAEPGAPRGTTPLDDPRLAVQRAPGTTCLTALRPGATPERRVFARNDSKGCGTVMRVAPVGLLLEPSAAFTRGCDVSRITHGHPVGWLAGGAMASLVAHLVRGEPLAHAVTKVGERLLAAKGQARAGAHVARALSTGHAVGSMCGPDLAPAQIERLGGGWVAEEALAIAVACAAASPGDFATAVRLAVNHSGLSTGSMTGQLAGLLVGLEGIPVEWHRQVELGDLVTAVADDLAFGGPGERWWRARWPEEQG